MNANKSIKEKNGVLGDQGEATRAHEEHVWVLLFGLSDNELAGMSILNDCSHWDLTGMKLEQGQDQRQGRER